MTNEPPWNHTSTGCGPGLSGAHTLSVRQAASSVSATPMPGIIRPSGEPASCGADGPNVAPPACASNARSSGAANRGACAYGIPSRAVAIAAIMHGRVPFPQRDPEQAERFVPGAVIVGTQWGDEGKGRVTDYLAKESSMCVRYQ